MYKSLLKCSELYLKAIWRGRKDYREEPWNYDSWQNYEPWRTQQLPPKRYWGKKASGLLFLCREDGTILLLRRSMQVEDPGTWGIPGGAIGEGFAYIGHGEKDPDNKTFLQSAIKETAEELGTVPRTGTLLTTSKFRDGDFTYQTFIYDIPLKEKERISKNIVLNWENDHWLWFKFDKLPSNMHPGVIFALKTLLGHEKEEKEEEEES